ncbi:MAG: hypothetical protein LBP36_01345 [Oscillospiraceae bacterium]|nr:hypothetical protein [Oscillospiraceae bacterium]
MKKSLEEWVEAVHRSSPESRIIFVGTKKDLVSEPKINELKGKLEGLTKTHVRFHYCLTSAIRDEGLEDFWNIIKTNINIADLPTVAYQHVAHNAYDDVKKNGKDCLIL